MYTVSVRSKRWFKREFERVDNKELLRKNMRYYIEKAIELWEWGYDIHLPTEIKIEHYNDREELVHTSIEDISVPAYTITIKKATTSTHIPS